jgi:hypothetical protein
MVKSEGKKLSKKFARFFILGFFILCSQKYKKMIKRFVTSYLVSSPDLAKSSEAYESHLFLIYG